MFAQLLGVTGVGPKSALGVLSALTVDQIADAVAADDDAPFRRVSGIGPKTAKLIVVQLAGKLEAPGAHGIRGRRPRPPSPRRSRRRSSGSAGASASRPRPSPPPPRRHAGSERASVPALLRLTLAALGPARKEPRGG